MEKYMKKHTEKYMDRHMEIMKQLLERKGRNCKAATLIYANGQKSRDFLMRSARKVICWPPAERRSA